MLHLVGNISKAKQTISLFIDNSLSSAGKKDNASESVYHTSPVLIWTEPEWMLFPNVHRFHVSEQSVSLFNMVTYSAGLLLSPAELDSFMRILRVVKNKPYKF